MLIAIILGFVAFVISIVRNRQFKKATRAFCVTFTATAFTTLAIYIGYITLTTV